jgi:putative sigma-54 modulation protein
MNKTPKQVKINVTFRNTEATEALRTDKLSASLKKLVHQDTEASVVLQVQKKRQIAEASFHTDGANFKGSEESEDMYKSIDNLVNSVTEQLRRHKEKMTEHH